MSINVQNVETGVDMKIEMKSEKTEKFLSATVHHMVQKKMVETPATNFKIPDGEVVKDVQAFLRESFLKRHDSIIKACATKKLKKEVRESLLNATFTDITLHVHNYKRYGINDDAHDIEIDDKGVTCRTVKTAQ